MDTTGLQVSVPLGRKLEEGKDYITTSTASVVAKRRKEADETLQAALRSGRVGNRGDFNDRVARKKEEKQKEDNKGDERKEGSAKK